MRWLVGIVLASGCGRIDFAARTGDGGAGDAPDARDAPAAPACAFGAPQIVPINSAVEDWEPALSPDGQLLLMSSSQFNGSDFRIYVAHAQGASFTQPILVDLSTPAGKDDFGPDLVPLGAGTYRLYFGSNRLGPPRLFTATFDGTVATNIAQVDGMQTTDAEAPWVSRDELEMFYDDSHIPKATPFRATRAATTVPWSPGETVPELDVGSTGWPAMADDERTLYFESDRSGNQGIYTATRTSRGGPFTNVAPLTVVNIPQTETGDPTISGDGKTLCFASNHGSDADVYMSRCL